MYASYGRRRYKATNTNVRIIDSLFLLAKALLRYVSQLFEVSGSTLAYPRFRPPRVGTDVLLSYLQTESTWYNLQLHLLEIQMRFFDDVNVI